jgi:hypothetical protein
MDNVTSLALQYTLSDPAMASQAPGSPPAGLPTEEVPEVLVPPRGERFPQLSSLMPHCPGSQLFHPSGLKGPLDVQVAVVGYRDEVLGSVGASTPPTLPAPPTPFQEDEDYDYDYDDSGEPVGRAEQGGLAEEIQLTLATDAELEALYD